MLSIKILTLHESTANFFSSIPRSNLRPLDFSIFFIILYVHMLKSTLFNALTGLNQKTGNFPGVTVEKHTGKVRISGMANQPSQTINFIDLPGTYCLYPKSPDELETLVALIDRNSSDFPDLILMVADGWSSP